MDILTIKNVKQWIQNIKDNKNDCEAAHSIEDDLYGLIISAIAHGTIEDAGRICRLALKTKEIKFGRWCA